MSWKQYGGIYKNDKLNNIKTENLFTRTFGMETSYMGDFDISGGLNVDNNVVVGNNILVANSITSDSVEVLHDCNVYGNTIVYTNLTVVGNLNASNTNVDNVFDNLVSNGTLKVASDAFLNANTYVKDTLFFNGNTDINGGIFQQGGGIGDGASLTAFSKKIGVNMDSPVATFDICGNSVSSLNVYTTQNFSRNTIVQNATKKGIVVNTDNTSSYIEFYNDNAILGNVVSSTGNDNNNAVIKYSVGGNLNIATSKNLLLSCPLSISANSVVDGVGGLRNSGQHICDETLVVYDSSSSYGVFQQGIYNNSAAISGNCITLVANNDSSTTFMNIITPNIATHRGISIGGGAFFGDVSRNMGTLGWFDVSGYYNPAEIIVSGNNNSCVPSTVGFNTFSPKTEKYCLDINGPVHINNGILKITGNTAFDVKSLNIMNRNVNNVIAVGSPSIISSSPFIQNLYYSNNGGKTWNISRISPPNPPVPGNATDLETSTITFNSCFSFDTNNSVIVGDNGYVFYTANGGELWNQYALSPATSQSFKSVFIDSSNIVFGSGLILKYFVRVAISNPPVKISISGSFLKSVDISTIVNYTQLPVGVTASLAINSIYGYSGVYYIAGGNSIIKLLIDSGSGGIFSNSISYLGSPVYLSNFFTNATTNYKSIYAYDAVNVVAVGENIITWTNTGGVGGWTNVLFSGVTFNSVFVVDSLHAIAVGDSAVIYISNDGYNTWNIISADLINSSGNSGILLNSSNNFKSVSMPDSNTVVISSTIVPSSGSVLGNSILIYCYLPNLFNNSGNYVLDISGSMQLGGNLFVENTASVGVVNVQRYLNSNMYEGVGFGNIYIGNSVVMNKTISIGDLTNSGGVRNTINIGGIYDTINIGNSVSLGGNSVSILGNSAAYFNDTFVLGNLTVSKNISYISGNAVVYGVTTLGNVANVVDSSGISTGTLVVKGGVGINSNLYTGGSVRFLNNTNSVSVSSGGLVCSGGVGILQNLYLGGNINVGGAVNNVTGNLVIGGNIGIGGNFSIVGNAVVNGDSFVVYGNSVISGNLVVSKNSLFSGAVTNSGGILGGGNIITTNIGAATAVGTGAIVCAGGVGVGGNLFVGGNAAVSGNVVVGGGLSVTGAVTNTGGILGGGNIITTNNGAATTSSTGAIVCVGGVGVGGNIFIGGNAAVSGNVVVGGGLVVNGATTHTGTTLLTGLVTNTGGISGGGNIITTNIGASTGVGTGAIVCVGGVGIGGNLFVGGNSVVSGNVGVSGGLTVTGATTFNGTTLLTGGVTNTGGILGGGNIITTNIGAATSVGTGAIVCGGGVGIGGNIFVGGNNVVSGNVVVGLGLTVSGATTHTGTTLLTGATTNTGGILGGGNIITTNVGAATSVGTGAIVCGGGVGVGGNIFVGGNGVVSGNVTVGLGLTVTGATTHTGTTLLTGAVTNTGGILGGGNIITTNVGAATNVGTGAIVCGGGVGISGNVYIGGNTVVSGNLFSGNCVTTSYTQSGQYIEQYLSQSISGTLTSLFSFLTGLIYYMTGTVTANQTSLTITNLPNVSAGYSYTFTFIFPQSGFYYTCSTITINGTAVTTPNFVNTTITAPTTGTFCIQHFYILCLGSTTYKVFTSLTTV